MCLEITFDYKIKHSALIMLKRTNFEQFQYVKSYRNVRCPVVVLY